MASSLPITIGRHWQDRALRLSTDRPLRRPFFFWADYESKLICPACTASHLHLLQI
jgi:hypothetical protein